MAASEPPGLLNELGIIVIVWMAFMCGYVFLWGLKALFLEPSMDGHFFLENWFYGNTDRKVHPQGRESYLPNNLHQASTRKLYAAKNKVNVFFGTAPLRLTWIHVALIGIGARKTVIEAADLVILEINENLPWTLGDTQIHISEVDYVVENHCPLAQLPVVPPSEAEEAIGGYIAELIEDGSTLQLGIGGIPNAITPFLMNRKDLGIHTEMFTDGMVDLYNAGVITNRRKTLWKGKMVGAFALGTKKLYDFVNNNLGVEFQQGASPMTPMSLVRTTA